MFASLERHDWNFWMWWMLFTVGGSIVALVAIVLLHGLLDLPFLRNTEGIEPTLVDQVMAMGLFGLSGAIIGFGQWLALRMIMPGSGRWILLSGAAWAVGYLTNLILAFVAGDLFNPAITLFLPWLVIGFWTGLSQWLILRGHYRRADLWVIITTIAVLLGGTGWIIGSVCGGSLTWAIAGAITGYTLLRFEADKIRISEE